LGFAGRVEDHVDLGRSIRLDFQAQQPLRADAELVEEL
jgi:hypothetical protein